MNTRIWSQLKELPRHSEVALSAVIVALGILVALREPNFLGVDNLVNALMAMVTIGIVALGQGFVIIAGELDLSVAATIAFSSVCAAWLMSHGTPVGVAVLVGILLGAFVGLLNALIVVGTGVSSFIVTLGTLSVIQGLTLLVTDGLPIAVPDSLLKLGVDTRIAGVPFPVVVFLILTLATQTVLVTTVFGRRVLAVGDNPEASRLAGLPVVSTRILVFVIAGALAGVAGMLRAASLGTSESSAGLSDLLPIIAAVVVGGVSLRGGRGSMVGVFLGAVLLGLVQNAYIILQLSSSLQLATFGAVIVVAGVFDQLRQGNIAWLSRLRSRRGSLETTSGLEST
jgi:ribose transport system permease protein